MRFRTVLLLNGKTATGFHVPPDVVASLGKGKRPPVVVTLNGRYTYRNTVAAYGAFGEALTHWDMSRVSAVLATAPLFTIGGMWAVEHAGLRLVPAEGLNGASIVGALMVVAGSMVCALVRR